MNSLLGNLFNNNNNNQNGNQQQNNQQQNNQNNQNNNHMNMNSMNMNQQQTTVALSSRGAVRTDMVAVECGDHITVRLLNQNQLTVAQSQNHVIKPFWFDDQNSNGKLDQNENFADATVTVPTQNPQNLVIEAVQVSLVVTLTDICGNTVSSVFDPSVDADPTCQQRSNTGKCCPSIQHEPLTAAVNNQQNMLNMNTAHNPFSNKQQNTNQQQNTNMNNMNMNTNMPNMNMNNMFNQNQQNNNQNNNQHFMF
jgi:hypothetical protein